MTVQPLKGKARSLCWQGVSRGLKKNACLGSGCILTSVLLTAATFKPSGE